MYINFYYYLYSYSDERTVRDRSNFEETCSCGNTPRNFDLVCDSNFERAAQSECSSIGTGRSGPVQSEGESGD